MSRPHRRRVVPGWGAALLACATLAACAGTAGSSSSRPASAELSQPDGSVGQRAPSSAGSAESPGVKGGTADKSAVGPAALPAVAPDQLARRASVALQVKDIGQAVARVRAASAAVEGIVLAENIGATQGETPLARGTRVTASNYGEITISVPSTKLDAVVAELGQVGKVIRSTSTSENVGAQVVDTQSRVETMRVSVERVRGYLKAAKDLNQVVQMEAELTRRQADLEALEARLASLKGSVARSPIQVSLTTEPAAVVAEPDRAGFLVGLQAGWRAFTGSVSVLLTVLGAVLPFAALLALLGVPMWRFLRRRRSTPSPTVLPE